MGGGEAIAPTVGARAAWGRGWDVAVVGAGPAGSAAALAAREGGGSVLLLDKEAFPRGKVCGACLSGAGAAVLEGLGARDELASLGARRIARVRLAFRGREVVLPLGAGPRQGIVVVSREALDAALVRLAVARGCDWLPGARVRGVRRRGEWVEIETATGDLLAARAVVLATGLHGIKGEGLPLPAPRIARRSRIGVSRLLAPPPPPPGPDGRGAGEEIRMLLGRAGYVGVCRLETGRWNLAAALDPLVVRREGVGGAVRAIAREAAGRGGGRRLQGVPLEGVPLEGGRWRTTPLLTRRRSRRAGAGILLAGDAAGYLEPVTGEGITWALTSGMLAGGLAGRAAREGWGRWVERAYEGSYRRLVVRRQRRCRLLAAAVRRPWVCGVLGSGLGRWPALARRIGSPGSPGLES